MDTDRLNQGEMIAAVSAVLLLLIMFIFSWFGFGGDLGSQASAAGFDTGFNAWQSFGFIDIILFITIVVAIGGAVMTANAQSVNSPVAISSITAGLGILSVLLILFRIISPPDFGTDVFGGSGIDVSRKIGVFLGLIAAGGIAYGGWRAMQAEGTSFSGEADRIQNRPPSGGGAPPPPPPPPASGGTPPASGGTPPASGGTGV
jgi:hypothetical protein